MPTRVIQHWHHSTLSDIKYQAAFPQLSKLLNHVTIWRTAALCLRSHFLNHRRMEGERKSFLWHQKFFLAWWICEITRLLSCPQSTQSSQEIIQSNKYVPMGNMRQKNCHVVEIFYLFSALLIKQKNGVPVITFGAPVQTQKNSPQRNKRSN